MLGAAFDILAFIFSATAYLKQDENNCGYFLSFLIKLFLDYNAISTSMIVISDFKIGQVYGTFKVIIG